MNEMDIENNNQFLHYLPESEEVEHFIEKDARQIENSSNCIKSNSAAAFPSLELESKKRRFDFAAKV